MDKERGIKITNIDKDTKQNGVLGNVVYMLDCPCCKSKNTSCMPLDGVRYCLDCDAEWAM